MSSLTRTSYIVLGLVAECGPSTPYDLKQVVARSVGYFWSVPHSQLYAEPVRLAEAGLLHEQQEEGGRRRRTYTLTDAGREALRAWLAEPSRAPVELRDPGLLQLFFADHGDRDDPVRLAHTRLAVHRERLATYVEIDGHLRETAPDELATRTVRRGIYAEEGAVRFWQELLDALTPGDSGIPSQPA